MTSRRGSAASSAARSGAGGRRPQAAPGDSVALFADVLIIGLLATLATLGIVTGYVAIVAACSLLREAAAGHTGVGPRTYGRRLREVFRSGAAGLVVPPVAAAVLAMDAIAVHAGIPGARPLAVLLVAVSVAAVLVGMRAAGAWRPGLRWGPVLRLATDRAKRDPRGDALLLLVAACATVLAVVVPMALPLMPGMLALAIVAVTVKTTPDDVPRG